MDEKRKIMGIYEDEKWINGINMKKECN